MKTLTNTFIKVIILTSILLCVLAVNYLQAAWSGPSGAPPAGNVDAPINTGSVGQVKNAPLSVNGLTSYSNSNYFFGALGQQFTIRPGYKDATQNAAYTTLDMPGNDTLYISDHLEVSNDIRADRYCDQSGVNCTDATDLGGVGSGLATALSNVVSVEEVQCIRDYTLSVHSVVATCPPNHALLSCSGGPGDISENLEGWWMSTDYSAKTCTLNIRAPYCISQYNWTYQRATANCLPL